MVSRTVYLADEMYLGRGYDPVTQTAHRQAIQDIPQNKIKTLMPGSGQDKWASLGVIKSRQELLEKLNVEASISYSGLFSSSAQAKYLKEMKMNKYSTLVLAYANIENSAEKITGNVNLTSEAEDVLKQRGWNEFIQIYGTNYLSAVKTGGRFYGMILIESTNAEEQENIAVAFNFDGFGVDANAKFERAFKEVTKNHQTTIKIIQTGGKNDLLETTPEEMIKQWKTFPELIAEHPVPIEGTFEEYEDTIVLPENMGGTLEQKRQQQEVLQELGEKYLYYLDYRDNVDFVLTHMMDFEEYQSLTDKDFKATRKRLEEDFEGYTRQCNEIVEQARKCRESIDACPLSTSYYQRKEKLPEIQGQNMMLKKLEEEVANLRNAITALGNGKVGIGTTNPVAKLNVVNQPQDAGGDTLILGSTNASNLRLGYDTNYSWIQSHGGRPLSINPIGNNVGIGTTSPKVKLDVNGEIRGKLWYSDEYILDVPNNSQIVRKKMLPCRNCAAFITSVKGKFEGGGEAVWVEVNPDGFWYLCGRSNQEGVQVKARCIGRP